MNDLPRHPVPRAAASRWLTVNVVAQLAFGLLAMTICLPSMQDWPATFGASQAAVQLSFSGYIAAYGLLQLVYGPLSDRHGRKPVLLVGLALGVAGSLLAAFAPNLTMLTVARMIQGAGTAAGMVIGRALVQDLFQGPDRTRMMAFVGMTMGLCPPAATLLGGQLHVRLGWQANFLVMAALGTVLWIAAWRGLPDRAPAAPSTGRAAWRALLSGYGRLAREPAFLLFVLLMAVTTATFYTFLGGAPLVLGRYGVTPESLGLYIMCIPLSYIVGNWCTTRLVRRWPDRTIMLLGQVATLTGLGLLLALAVAGINTPLSLALPLLLLGIGHGLLVPPTLAGTVGLIPALAGSAAAVAGVTQQLVGAFGGYAVGLVPHEGAANMALLMLMWTGIGLAAQVVLFRFFLRRT
ncbi:multidrug effflux MFS transporter [Caenimonas sedimenti]|nr:multidrug effflux MFS transporter [Caenimonas sedimenti]